MLNETNFSKDNSNQLEKLPEPVNQIETIHSQFITNVDRVVKEINKQDLRVIYSRTGRVAELEDVSIYLDDCRHDEQIRQNQDSYPKSIDIEIFGYDLNIPFNEIYSFESELLDDDFIDYWRIIQEMNIDLQFSQELNDKRITWLDKQRAAIHDRGAAKLIANKQSEQRYSDLNLKLDQRNAKKIFELLFYIWQNSKTEELYYGDELRRVDEKELIKKIKDQTGLETHVSAIVWGFHENRPTTQYNVMLKGNACMYKLNEVKKIIDQLIDAVNQKKNCNE